MPERGRAKVKITWEYKANGSSGEQGVEIKAGKQGGSMRE